MRESCLQSVIGLCQAMRVLVQAPPSGISEERKTQQILFIAHVATAIATHSQTLRRALVPATLSTAPTATATDRESGFVIMNCIVLIFIAALRNAREHLRKIAGECASEWGHLLSKHLCPVLTKRIEITRDTWDGIENCGS